MTIHWQDTKCAIYIACTKTKPEIFLSTILISTDEIIIKFGKLIPETTQDTAAVAFLLKPV